MSANRRLPLLPPTVLKGSLRADGSRDTVHPADVHGRFDRARTAVFYALIVLWAALPWVKIAGNPAVFLDVEHRQFFLFGATFNAQDTPLLFFLLSGVGFGLVFVTALLGRVWCGWACPQTVFLEGVFRKIERLVEGPREVRMRRNKGDWTLDKLWRKVVVHAAYALAAFAIAHIILSYFTSMPGMLHMIHGSPSSHPEAFAWAAGLTLVLYFDFSWFREQMCLVICPYGRLQSALIDAESMVVGYDERRGEPRHKGKEKAEGQGDCIECGRCVAVCPTGIDIRNGLQIDCIGCTACIDACDDIMVKVERPRGLIRYSSSSRLAGEPGKILRPRVYAYTALLLVGVVVAVFGFRAHTSFEASLQRLAGPPYVLDGDVIEDSFEVRLVNKTSAPVTYLIEPDPILGVTFVVPLARVEVPAMGNVRGPVFVTLPKSAYTGDFPVHIKVRPEGGAPGDERVVIAQFLGVKK